MGTITDPPRRQEPDELRTAIGRITRAIEVYLFTVAAVWIRRKRLLSHLSAQGERYAGRGPAPLPPLLFLSTTLAVLVALQEIVFPGANVELPGPAERLAAHLPLNAIGLFLALVMGQAVIPYILLRLTGQQLTFSQIWRSYCYQQGGIIFPLSIALIITNLVIGWKSTQSIYSATIPWLLAVSGLVLLYAVIWLAKQINLETGIRFFVCLAAVLAGLSVFVLLCSELAPKIKFNIPSRSMEPSIEVDDVMLANAWVYRWRMPRRGEIALFLHPKYDAAFMKRIIGLPGDRIELMEGELHINDRPVELEQIEDWVGPKGEVFDQYIEALPGGSNHRIILPRDRTFSTRLDANNTQALIVPKGSYFVLGDNRAYSSDSRDWGFVPQENIVGHVYVRLLPLDSPPLE